MPYRAPLGDFALLLRHGTGFDTVAATERFAEATPETVEAVLSEAARLSEQVIAPLQRVGDRQPARLDNGVTRTPPGFAEAWAQLAGGGWLGLAAAPEAGGMGLPMTVATCVNEMMSGACLAFQIGPLLTQGQIEALEHHADDALKAMALPPLVSGAWSGTMNLTEPQAGSDVGALTTRAEPAGDGTYRITGQKIYISWGDNEFTDNVSHLVLARLPGAPAGPKGISLFLVPRHHPQTGAPNGVRTVGLEHKLGLHGSPTATLAYEGATGWLVGAENGGLRAMFTMMNNARLGVGVQGIGVAEAALQQAVAHAAERVQGATPPGREASILGHSDVRRMLAVMRAEVFAARAIALTTAVATDMATATGDPAWAARAGVLTPVAKAFGTDTGVAVAGMAMQVQGGAAYVEDTGAAQFLRDVRVTTIYEGTNGIQAMDLVGRKLADGGAAARAILQGLDLSGPAALSRPLAGAREALALATATLAAEGPARRGGGAAAFLRAWARVLGGAAHLAAARAEQADGAPPGPRSALAAVYMRRLLPETAALCAEAVAGEEDLDALDATALDAAATGARTPGGRAPGGTAPDTAAPPGQAAQGSTSGAGSPCGTATDGSARDGAAAKGTADGGATGGAGPRGAETESAGTGDAMAGGTTADGAAAGGAAAVGAAAGGATAVGATAGGATAVGATAGGAAAVGAAAERATAVGAAEGGATVGGGGVGGSAAARAGTETGA